MNVRLLAAVAVLAPALAGCAVLGPGSHYDVTVETSSIGRVVAEGTPASNAAIFVSLTDQAADEPVPRDRTHDAGTVDPGVLEIPADMEKLVARLRLDVQGQVRYRVPTDRPVDMTVRIEEDPPAFDVSGKDCPEPRKLRSSLERFDLDGDRTYVLPFYVVCDAD